MESNTSKYFDSAYGVSSVSITAAGLLAVSSTKVAYFGISLLASTTNQVSILVYDSINATTGNLLDVILVQQGKDRQGERTIPIMAKNGITIGVTGTGGRGVIFYGPRG
jgi:hypothetical protein